MTLRKTLWERLKPEYKESILKDSERYPHTTKRMIHVLSNECYIGDILFSDAEALGYHHEDRDITLIRLMFE